MKKVFIAVGAVLGLALVGALGAASMQPADYEVQRIASFKASPAQLYSVISDFNRYREWSPWEKLDPELAATVTGEPGQVGHRYEWSGNNQAGQGSMTIVRAEADQEIELKLDFLKPFKAQSEVFWTLRKTEDGCEMVWRMVGHNPDLISKFFSLAFDMDKMVGGSFDEGLANLKRVVSSGTEPEAPESGPPAE